MTNADYAINRARMNRETKYWDRAYADVMTRIDEICTNAYHRINDDHYDDVECTFGTTMRSLVQEMIDEYNNTH